MNKKMKSKQKKLGANMSGHLSLRDYLSRRETPKYEYVSGYEDENGEWVEGEWRVVSSLDGYLVGTKFFVYLFRLLFLAAIVAGLILFVFFSAKLVESRQATDSQKEMLDEYVLDGDLVKIGTKRGAKVSSSGDKVTVKIKLDEVKGTYKFDFDGNLISREIYKSSYTVLGDTLLISAILAGSIGFSLLVFYLLPFYILRDVKTKKKGHVLDEKKWFAILFAEIAFIAGAAIFAFLTLGTMSSREYNISTLTCEEKMYKEDIREAFKMEGDILVEETPGGYRVTNKQENIKLITTYDSNYNYVGTEMVEVSALLSLVNAIAAGVIALLILAVLMFLIFLV